MKAAEFSYECPQTLGEALELMSEEGIETRLIAGGQSLVPMMNFRLAQPDRLLDLNRISDLAFVRENGDVIEIGAMTRMAQLESSAPVVQHVPLIAMALPHVAHSAIRNRGTIGGSLALADPAAELPAVLLALGARLHCVSSSGERVVNAEDFFHGPYETELRPDEIMRMIAIPKPASEHRVAFQEVARRHGDYAMAGVAVGAIGGDRLSEVRIAFFGTGDRPVRAVSAEAALNDRPADDEQAVATAIERVADLSFSGDLNADAAMKCHLARVVLKRALSELTS